MLIDFHTHIFPEKIAQRALEKMSSATNTPYFTNGTSDGLKFSMKEAGVSLSVNLPVMTSPDQVEKVNTSLIEQKECLRAQGILTFAGMHPDYKNPQKELKRLRAHHITGIKLHPAYQKTDIDDIRYLRIMECASAEGLIIVTHAGLDIGIPGKNWAPLEGILRVIRETAPEKLVLAHMGSWQGWQEVEKSLCGAPVFFDTAFSLGPLAVKNSEKSLDFDANLTSEFFTRLVRKHGSEKILFGSDSPWERPALYRDFIMNTCLSSDEKEAIFHGNAERLLSLA